MASSCPGRSLADFRSGLHRQRMVGLIIFQCSAYLHIFYPIIWNPFIFWTESFSHFTSFLFAKHITQLHPPQTNLSFRKRPREVFLVAKQKIIATCGWSRHQQRCLVAAEQSVVPPLLGAMVALGYSAGSWEGEMGRGVGGV